MKKIFHRSCFWLGIFAICLVVLYVFIYPNTNMFNLLGYCNFLLFALLHVLNIPILPAYASGTTYTDFQIILIKVPYSLVYIASFIVYGIIIDVIFKRMKLKWLTSKLSYLFIALSTAYVAISMFIAYSDINDMFGGLLVIIGFWHAVIMFILGIHFISFFHKQSNI